MSETHRLAEQLVADLVAQNRTLTTVESCTGGLVFVTMTDIALHASDRRDVTDW